jgi:hypothetical protein
LTGSPAGASVSAVAGDAARSHPDTVGGAHPFTPGRADRGTPPRSARCRPAHRDPGPRAGARGPRRPPPSARSNEHGVCRCPRCGAPAQGPISPASGLSRRPPAQSPARGGLGTRHRAGPARRPQPAPSVGRGRSIRCPSPTARRNDRGTRHCPRCGAPAQGPPPPSARWDLQASNQSPGRRGTALRRRWKDAHQRRAPAPPAKRRRSIRCPSPSARCR